MNKLRVAFRKIFPVLCWVIIPLVLIYIIFYAYLNYSLWSSKNQVEASIQFTSKCKLTEYDIAKLSETDFLDQMQMSLPLKSILPHPNRVFLQINNKGNNTIKRLSLRLNAFAPHYSDDVLNGGKKLYTDRIVKPGEVAQICISLPRTENTRSEQANLKWIITIKKITIDHVLLGVISG